MLDTLLKLRRTFVWLLFMGVYGFRRRLPLYADDSSKIFSAYAEAILDLSITENLSFSVRRRLWDAYASRFYMDYSIRRFYDKITSDEAVQADYQRWISQDHSGRFFESLSKHTERYQNFHPLTDDDLKSLGDIASLILSGVEKHELAENESFGFKSINIYSDHPTLCPVTDQLNRAESLSSTHYELCYLSDVYTRPESEVQIQASKVTDDISAELATLFLETEEIAGAFHEDIREDLALLISDFFYRVVLDFEGLQAAISNLPTQRTVILTPENIDLAPKLFKQGLKVLCGGKIYTDTPYEKNNLPNFRTDSKAFSTKLWQHNVAKMDTKITKGLTYICRKADHNSVFIFCNRRSSSYDKAVKRIEYSLGSKFPIHTVNSGAHFGLKNNLKGVIKCDLPSALYSWQAGELVGLPEIISQLMERAIDNVAQLDETRCKALKTRLRSVVERNFGVVVAHGRLYFQLKKFADNLPKSTQAILAPGRDPAVRIMARAVQAAGLKTIDTQVLFVSEMSRYKSPMADQLAVIDSHARDHFCTRYGYSHDSVQLMGSINLESDIALSLSIDKAAIAARYFDNPNAQIVTYAMQPLTEKDLLRGLRWCLEMIEKLKDVNLIIKLHPAQSDGFIEVCESFMSTHMGSNEAARWVILKDPPFYELIAISDVLLTHYSNVALLAAVCGKAVGALPVFGDRPTPTLSDMKISEDINTAEQLITFVRKNIERAGEVKAEYLIENPHMTTAQSMQILGDMLTKNIAEFNETCGLYT